MTPPKALQFFILFCLGLYVHGQNPNALVLNKNHGLLSKSVFDIHQDQKGFLWLATGEGLCRYNGKEFKYFKSTTQTMKSGSCIKEDKKGRIWYSNFDGFLFYVEDDVLKSFPQQTNSGFKMFGITEDYIYLPLDKSIHIYNLETFKLEKEIAFDDKITAFTQENNELYVLTQDLFQIRHLAIVQKTHFPLDTQTEFIAPLLTAFDGKLYFFSKFSNDYFYYQQGHFYKRTNKSFSNFIQNVNKTKEHIWISTPNGILRLDDDSEKCEKLFDNLNIACVYVDQYEQYWIGTLHEGLYFVPNFSTLIDVKTENPSRLRYGHGNKVCATNHDKIYLNDELIFYSPSNHAVSLLHYDTLNNQLAWMSSKFYIYDLNDRKVVKENIVAIKDIIQLDQKYYAYAASGSIGLINLRPNLKSGFDDIISTEIGKDLFRTSIKEGINGRAVAVNNKNQLYFGTNQGLLLYEKSDSKELFFQNKKIYLTQLKSFDDIVYGLSTDEKMYLIKGANIQAWDAANAMMKNNTLKIFKAANRLYLYSGKDLIEYNIIKDAFEKIYFSNDNEIRDIVFENNILKLVTSKGILTFGTNTRAKQPKAFLEIKNLIVDGKTISNQQAIELDAHTKVIRINYNYINFKPFENHIIEYQINDGQWSESQTNNDFIQLYSLAPNTYDLKIRVKGHENTLKNIRFSILKPWYIRWYAFVGYFIVLAGIGLIIQRNQTKKIHQKNNEKLEKLELEKNLNLSTLKAIKSQMNPHFFFNALNTLQAFILSNDKLQAINYLSRFSALTRSILEMTEKESVSLEEEISMIMNYLEIEKGRFQEDFVFHIHVDENIDGHQEKIPSMIIQPYVENALKHGLLHKQGKKVLEIDFLKKDNKLIVKIVDNGVGRQKSAELNVLKNKNHTSFATNAIKNRIDLLNKNNAEPISIRIIDQKNDQKKSLGTEVILTFPLSKM